MVGRPRAEKGKKANIQVSAYLRATEFKKLIKMKGDGESISECIKRKLFG